MGSLLVLLFDYEWVFSKDAVGVIARCLARAFAIIRRESLSVVLARR